MVHIFLSLRMINISENFRGVASTGQTVLFYSLTIFLVSPSGVLEVNKTKNHLNPSSFSLHNYDHSHFHLDASIDMQESYDVWDGNTEHCQGQYYSYITKNFIAIRTSYKQ